MRFKRIFLYSAACFLLFIVLFRFGVYHWQEIKTRNVHNHFIYANPGIMKQPASLRVLKKAQYILDNVKETRYSHWTSIDEQTGKYYADCSGLVCFILRAAAPESFRSVPVEMIGHRPRAKCFYRIFADSPENSAQNGWMRIRSLYDAAPGDFIAWEFPGAKHWENSGHVMMILEKPVIEENNTVRVRILDSTGGRHAEDTRKNGETGIGAGIIWFTVDEDGAPVAYQTSENKAMRYHDRISIGRPVDIR